MDIKRAIAHPVETFRTAPVGITMNLVSDAVLCYSITHMDSGGLETFGSVLTATFSSMYAALGGLMAYRQLGLRDRLEPMVKRRGYDDRLFATTTSHYCDRQTARVVCQSFGVLDQYQALCDRDSQDSQLTWLPHI